MDRALCGARVAGVEVGHNGVVDRIEVVCRRVADAPTGPLSPVEAARAGAMSERRRSEYVAGVGLLRQVAGRALDLEPGSVEISRACRDCGKPHGRPVIEGLGCSVSHSDGYVAVAIGQGQIGLDIEVLRELDYAGLLDRVLAPGEDPPGSSYEFQRVWCRKEALHKATGEGLARPMTTLALDGSTVVDGLNARVVDLDLGAGLVGALARLGQREFRTS